MNNFDVFEILIFLISLAIIQIGAALKFRVSYPIFLVIGGCILGFIPGLQGIRFDPDLVLTVVLPPVLYYAAFNIPFKEFNRNITEILSLALGLVIITTLVVGLLFKWLFPDLPYALAFAFGAIISPPDAIAATTILKRFSISPRLQAVLEGESLINDATGLVLYRLAVIALLTGSFSLQEASYQFTKIASGGIVIGLIMGVCIHNFSSYIFGPILAVVYSFTIPYLTYFIADRLQVSGVLAVVTCGLIGSRLSLTKFHSLTRVMAWTAWDVFIIFLNCFVFTIIGLELNTVMKRLTVHELLLCLLYGLLFTILIITVRFVYVFIRKSFEYFSAIKGCSPHQHIFRDAVIISWAGMRGIVSLTAVLAMPVVSSSGEVIVGYDIVVLLTFVVIFMSLIIPGLSMPYILKKLNITASSFNKDTHSIRIQLLDAANDELSRLCDLKHLNNEEVDFLKNYFFSRHTILEAASSKKKVSNLNNGRLLVISKKRQLLLKLWEDNIIDDKMFNLFEYELDLEESTAVRTEI